MFQDLYVIKDTGECLYHKSNSPDSIDPTIVSSFLSAIDAFGQNVDKGASMLETTSSRFVYHHLRDIMLVARVPKEYQVNQVQEVLEHIATKIKKLNFKSTEFTGDVREFQKIEADVARYAEPSLMPNTVLEINPLTVFRIVDGTSLEKKIYSIVRFKQQITLKELFTLLKEKETDLYDTVLTLLRRNILQTKRGRNHKNYMITDS